MDLSAMDAALQEQAANVAERVRRTRMDFHHPAEIARVRQGMADVLEELGEPTVITSFANPDSKRATFLVEMPDGTPGVLKVAGATETGEAEVLQAWRDHGVAAAEPLAYGHVGSCTYIVTRFQEDTMSLARVLQDRMAAAGPTATGGGPTVAEDPLRATLEDVFVALRRAHLPASTVPNAETLNDRLEIHLNGRVDRLEEHGFALPPGFHETLDTLMTGRVTLIHGDSWVGNMVTDDAGGIILIDPAGCVGPPEYDSAQVIAQVTPQDRIPEMIRLACNVDPSLDSARIEACLGVYLVGHAGYARASEPALNDIHELTGPERMDAARSALATRRLLGLSARLMSRPFQVTAPATERPVAERTL